MPTYCNPQSGKPTSAGRARAVLAKARSREVHAVWTPSRQNLRRVAIIQAKRAASRAKMERLAALKEARKARHARQASASEALAAQIRKDKRMRAAAAAVGRSLRRLARRALISISDWG